MSRTPDRALALVTLLMALVALGGCEQLDGRNRNRKGNRFFRETKFIDSAAEYEKAVKTVDDPTIHYNLGLAYSKVFKPGADGQIPLGIKGSFVCDQIPQVKYVSKQVCVKPGDRRFDECDAKHVCASSFSCQQTELCTIDNAVVADMAGQHFGVWLKANPSDAQTRGIMTQVWLDSSQYKKAIDYWEAMLSAKPNDPEIMGSLAGINLKANDWRKSIEWYTKVAQAVTDPASKVGAYQFIGNVAWAKLNSKLLTSVESLELADKGIGALQRAAELNPKNPKFFGLMASIYNFRALSQGASWAAGLDRASAQDLQLQSRVLSDEAKKAQGLLVTPPPAPPAPGGAANVPTPAPLPGASAGGGAKTGG